MGTPLRRIVLNILGKERQIMAHSRAVAEKLSAPPNFRFILLTGMMLAGAAFLIQSRPVQMEALRLAAPVSLRIIDASAPPPPVFNPEAGLSASELMQRWEPMIGDAARRFNIPAAWIRNVMRSESGGRAFLNGQPITSNRGALGLMQVEPGTYAEMAAQYRLGADPFDPKDNIYAGAAYLRWLHGKYGFPAMFAAYNTGPGHLEDHLFHGAPLPAETRAYVAGITKALGAGAQWLARANKLTLTAPNGSKIALDPAKIRSVRSVLPGEYAPGVAAVIDLGQTRQGVRESPDVIAAALAPSRHGA
jgi:soluble lytic murein transglycosylase-like protein